MAYYLGRDVIVALTTEDSATGLQIDVTDNKLQTFVSGTGIEHTSDIAIAGGRHGAVFGSIGSGNSYSNQVSDLIGCELSIGTVDEDITYLGQRSVLKAEIKKETTITLTRKKSDMSWDVLFNGDGTNTGRYGVKGTDSFHTGLEDPGVNDFGFRVYVKLNSGEYFMAPNCCVQAHTVTLNPDGTTEETLELMSYLDPVVSNAVNVDDAGAF